MATIFKFETLKHLQLLSKSACKKKKIETIRAKGAAV